jgi:hypothetical protein
MPLAPASTGELSAMSVVPEVLPLPAATVSPSLAGPLMTVAETVGDCWLVTATGVTTDVAATVID